jgi:hypothetical protein
MFNSTLSLALSPPCRRWLVALAWLLQACRPRPREHRLCTVCQCQHGIAEPKPSKLGDLTAFRSIATDVAAIVTRVICPPPRPASRIWRWPGIRPRPD